MKKISKIAFILIGILMLLFVMGQLPLPFSPELAGGIGFAILPLLFAGALLAVAAFAVMSSVRRFSSSFQAQAAPGKRRLTNIVAILISIAIIAAAYFGQSYLLVHTNGLDSTMEFLKYAVLIFFGVVLLAAVLIAVEEAARRFRK